jgi:hypothetical protein
MPFKNIEDLRKWGKKYYLINKEKKKEYRLKNKDTIKEKRRLYILINKERIKKYRIDNKERIKEVKKKYYLKKPHIQCALNAKRKAIKLKATPKFANLEKIKEIYKNCPKGYHVDHIIPLQGKNVCGLHVEWNLQYLTPSANISKSNKLIY